MTAEEIKRALILITQSCSWKFDLPKKQFWMLCKNEAEANQIIDKLPQLTHLNIRHTKEGATILLWSHETLEQYTGEIEALIQEHGDIFQCHEVIMSKRPDITAKDELVAVEALRLTGLFNNQMNPNREEFNSGLETLSRLGLNDNPYSRALRMFPRTPGSITLIDFSILPTSNNSNSNS